MVNIFIVLVVLILGFIINLKYASYIFTILLLSFTCIIIIGIDVNSHVSLSIRINVNKLVGIASVPVIVS